LILITEYNPAIEKYKTGEFINEIFIKFLNEWITLLN
jgi:hypothetical protein